jgi:hypothetical protein
VRGKEQGEKREEEGRGAPGGFVVASARWWGRPGRHLAGVAGMRSPRDGRDLPQSGQRGARAGEGDGCAGMSRAVELPRAHALGGEPGRFGQRAEREAAARFSKK